MVIVPNQFFGLGDIIFTQTLVRRIANGRPIVWPVLPQFVEGLNRAYPDIKFVNYKEFPIAMYERRDQHEAEYHGYGLCTVLPLRHNVELMNVPYSQCMSSKYEMYGMNWREWKELAMWKEDTEAVHHLWNIHLLKIGQGGFTPFTLVNNTFGSDGKLGVDIPTQSNEVRMNITTNFSLFDWRQLITGASAIHTVSTSIIYLLEMLELKAPEVHLYVRKPLETDFRNVDYLLQKHKYVLHV